jgi:hypothetical protein
MNVAVRSSSAASAVRKIVVRKEGRVARAAVRQTIVRQTIAR